MNNFEEIEKARALLQKYLDGKCDAYEQELVQRWFLSFDDKNTDSTTTIEEEQALKQLDYNLTKAITKEQQTIKSNQIKRLNSIISIAALLMVGIGLGFWYYSGNEVQQIDPYQIAKEIPALDSKNSNDILPGSHIAMISRPNGNKEVLKDSSFYSAIKNQKLDQSTVTLHVPKAGTFQIILEDGTKVWLNSETQLSYPEKFDEHERLVTLEGEAYFEVHKDAERPFRINVNNSQIEVLGTSFNVRAYANEFKTSLVEGSVKIKNQSQENILKPGEQAIMLPEGMKIGKANLKKNTAWKKGELYFDGENFSEVIEQIMRWYDVKFENLQLLNSESSYQGTINRNTNLSNVLEILSVATGKDFTIEGRVVKIN